MEVIPRKNVGKDEYKVKFPLSQGKIPGIEVQGLRLTETIAIVMVGHRKMKEILFLRVNLLIVVPDSTFPNYPTKLVFSETALMSKRPRSLL